MERISRALELARAEREGRSNAAAGTERREPRIVPESGVVTNLSVVDSDDDVDAGVEVGNTRVLQLPIVELESKRRDDERILFPGAAGAAAAPYRMLRTQVLKRLDQLNANSLAMIGATSGAGKTLTAINLGVAIAADSERHVLLVDLDLGNPTIHQRFGFHPEVGVEDCLSEGRPLSHAMFKVAGYDRLTILCARQRVERSSDLLRSHRAEQAVMEIRKRYANRIVIFDLPPALQADDALAFARYVQAGLLVVGEGRTRRDDVARTLELLHDFPIVGTVLNGSREPKPSPY